MKDPYPGGIASFVRRMLEQKTTHEDVEAFLRTLNDYRTALIAAKAINKAYVELLPALLKHSQPKKALH